MNALPPGSIRARDIVRSYRLVTDRNPTLKETLLRRKRTVTSTVEALRGVSFEVSPGEALGIIGRNGSGKSTMLKVLAGIIKPHGGEVEIAGTVASMLELGAGFHPDYTGRENVYLNGSIYGLSRAQVDERFDDIVSFAEIPDFVDAPVRTYSSGMYMRLAFAIASHVNPDVLLLDEVFAVGDESFQLKCMARMFDYQRRGGTIVLVSHDPLAIERVCDRAILLEQGTVAAEGPTDEVLATYHRALAGGGEAVTGESTLDEDDPRIWGNREAYIADCRLVGPRGRSRRFVNGEVMHIEMDIVPTRPIEAPTYGISISTTDGLLCFGTNTRRDSRTTGLLTEPTTVRFTVPSLPLQEGSFVAQFAVVSHDESVIYHWLDRWLEFSVFTSGSGVGIVNMGGTWQLGPAKGLSQDDAKETVPDTA